MTPTRQATQACAEWLAACIRLGWRKGDLDFLEALWWKYHDERGRLIGSGNQSLSEASASTSRSAAP